MSDSELQADIDSARRLGRDIAEARERLQGLTAERRVLIERVVAAIGPTRTAQGLDISRQTLADLRRAARASGIEPAPDQRALPLAALISRGLLGDGERLVINRRAADPVNGTLRADGQIIVNGQAFRSASAAACYGMGVRNADGWLRFRVPRLGYRTLASLRDELREG